MTIGSTRPSIIVWYRSPAKTTLNLTGFLDTSRPGNRAADFAWEQD
ncbi:MAG: hypothetical protein ACRDX9_00435 [Acidimicrobiia bacterium]